jgi:hypothetical protein
MQQVYAGWSFKTGDLLKEIQFIGSFTRQEKDDL